jgi:hypothetical protein
VLPAALAGLGVRVPRMKTKTLQEITGLRIATLDFSSSYDANWAERRASQGIGIDMKGVASISSVETP